MTWLLLALLAAGGTPPAPCDFDRDGFTTVVDLQRLVNRRLADQPTGKCWLAPVSQSIAWINAVILTWPPASDPETPTEELEYLVCYSPRDEINTVAECEAAVAMDWTPNVTRFRITHAQPGPYFVRVLVRDGDGHKRVYEGHADLVAPPRPR